MSTNPFSLIKVTEISTVFVFVLAELNGPQTITCKGEYQHV